MFWSGGGLLSESESHGFGLYSDGGAWRFKSELLQPGMNSAEDGEPAERCRSAGDGLPHRNRGCEGLSPGEVYRAPSCIFWICADVGCAARSGEGGALGLSGMRFGGVRFDGARKNVLALA